MMTVPPQAKRPRPKAKTAAGKDAKRDEAVRKALTRLAALRTDWKTAVAQHQLQTEARFRTVTAGLAAKPKDPKPSLKDVERILKLADVHLKPAKGRLRDLRHVDEALKAMLAQLPD